MLTPRFKIDQSEDTLVVTIYAPFTNVADTEVFFDDLDFRFYSRPYFLRLHLPHPVQETDDAKAHFDADTKSFVVTVPKKVKGQHFPGLEMLTDLLLPKGDTALPDHPLIEELGDPQDEIDVYFDQQIPPNGDTNEEEEAQLLQQRFGYGFGFKQTGVFDKLLEECQRVFEVQNLDEKPFKERRKERLENEDKAFSSDHYLADLFDAPDQLTECLRLAPKAAEDLTSEEQERMISISKRKRVHLSATEEMSACFGMLDILYAYCYESRANLFDEQLNPESGWTIQKLASTLSCGERFTNVKQVVTASLRRTLCYPLFRHYDLGIKVWRDVLSLLPFPRKIVKIFLTLIPQFVDENYGHLFNQLYIEDYAVWCQTLKAGEGGRLTDLKEALAHTLEAIKKSDLDLELDELEFAAKLTMEEASEKQERSVLNKLSGLKLHDATAQSDSDDDTSSDSDDDSSDSDSDSDDSESDSSSDESESDKEETSGINEESVSKADE